MKRLLILLAVPFLLAAPVYAAPLSPQNAAGDGGILSELEEALTEKDNNREEVFSEVEGALSDETGKYTENTGGNVDKALAGRPQEAAGEEAEDGWTVQEVRYQFEHSMLPRYYYDVPENMLSVIADPGIYVLWESVSTENGVDPTYSEDEYETYWYQAEDGTVIAQVTLPEPDQNMLCFRVYFVYNGETGYTAYYTVELEYFLDEDDGCPYICSWNAEREHALLADAEVVDKDSGIYEEKLWEEAEVIAELSGLPAELDRIGDAYHKPETSGTTDDPESRDAPDNSGLAEVPCPELGFSVMADPAYSWDYEEGTGITIYTESDGSIPYVIIYQSEDLIGEPFEYIQEQFTPYMQEEYGEDLLNFEENEGVDIGGKILPAGLYQYRVQEYVVDMVRFYDSTGDRTVAYTVKFLDGEGDTAIEALDTAIRTFQAE